MLNCKVIEIITHKSHFVFFWSDLLVLHVLQFDQLHAAVRETVYSPGSEKRANKKLKVEELIVELKKSVAERDEMIKKIEVSPVNHYYRCYYEFCLTRKKLRIL